MSNFLLEELDTVKQTWRDIPGAELITCVSANVRFKISRTSFKSVIVIMQFPPEYPAKPAIVEIKSKTWSQKLCEGLEKMVESESNKFAGQNMVMPLLRYVRAFIDDNPLCVCSEEIHEIKKTLWSPNYICKLKQKASQITLLLEEENYNIECRITVGDNYPEDNLKVEIVKHNYPQLLVRYIAAQAQDIARKCIMPPLKPNPKDPPFKIKPAVLPVATFIIRDAVRHFTTQRCPICAKPSLPIDPKDVVNDASSAMFVDRTFCQHLFHHGCLDKYMKTPPFAGGKNCPRCRARIYHNSWNITPELAEARWAHQEAKKRELDEVMDFLQ